MNISARVRNLFSCMRNSCRRGMPKFRDEKSQVEINRLLKEVRLHGLPNFVSDAVLEHMARTQMIPVLDTHGKHLIREVSKYMSICVSVLIHQFCHDYPSLASAFENAATKVIKDQTND